jgi:hypothetical protein
MTEKDVEECDALHRKIAGVSRLTSIREEAQSEHTIFVALSETGEIIGYQQRGDKKGRREIRGRQV